MGQTALHKRRFDNDEGIDFVRCRICGDHRRVISGRHLSKHDMERETYMAKYHLTPDELIAKDFRMIRSSRRGFYPHGKSDWIDAVTKLHTQGESVFVGDLQDNHAYLYNQGVWIFGDWDKALRAAGFDPKRMRLRTFWDKRKVIYLRQSRRLDL
jgi:ROS/MUCR transcriptional regulator protein